MAGGPGHDPGLERAELLINTGRYDLAEEHLRRELAHDPDDPVRRVMLAIVLAARDRLEEAEEETRRAIAAAPAIDVGHRVRSSILVRLHRHAEALDAAQQATQLDPADAVNWGQLADVQRFRQAWRESRDAAARGLSLNPDSEICRNLLAIAQVQLGERTEAAETLDDALRRDPENALSHANRGWTALHQGEPKRALTHFQEALRLEPGNEWAREGLLQALRAKNVFYRGLLAYFLWMQRLGPRGGWMVMIGAYFGMQALGRAIVASPDLAPYLRPVQIALVITLIMTWLGPSFVDLTLRFSRYGRDVLDARRRRASNVLALMTVIALALAAGWMLTDSPFYSLPALGVGLMTIPTNVVLTRRPGRNRTILALALGWLVALLAAIVALLFLLQGDLVRSVVTLFIISFIGFQLLANALTMHRPHHG